MTMRRDAMVMLGILAFMAVGFVAGCHDRTVVVRREPAVVYMPPPAPEVVYVQQAPPAVIYEPVPRLQPGFIWIEGYWNWDRTRYVWVKGHSERLPHERAIWIAPKYERTDRGIRYEPGHWADRGGPGGPGGPPMKGGPGGPGGPPPKVMPR
jgi:hypothetical protein